MAYRSPRRSSSRGKFNPVDALPIWTTTHSNAANMVFEMLMRKLGVTDVRSYFRVFRIPIAICLVLCACFGGSGYGLKGFVVGGLLGLAGPAALLWLGVMLIGVALFMVVYVLAWMAILFVLGWLLFR